MINTTRRTVAIASCLLMSFWSVPLASAHPLEAGPTALGGIVAAADTATTSAAFSLTVSPTRLAVDQTDIGKVQRIRVANGGAVPLSVQVQKRNFSGAADGSLNFEDNAPYSATRWLTATPTAFTVAPGATQVVTASISVPSNPDTGDHQVALVFLVPAGETSANVKINRGIGIPLYITVPGAVDTSTTPSELTAPGFATGGPIDLSVKVHDTGTVHRDFRGASPLLVNGTGSTTAFPDFTVMRGATREVSTTWSPPLFCICHLSVTVTNADGSTHTVSVRVIVLPLPLIGAILGGLLLLALAIYLLRRRYRATVIRAAAALNRPVSSGDA
jgi:hypothetical protein